MKKKLVVLIVSAAMTSNTSDWFVATQRNNIRIHNTEQRAEARRSRR